MPGGRIMKPRLSLMSHLAFCLARISVVWCFMGGIGLPSGVFMPATSVSPSTTATSGRTNLIRVTVMVCVQPLRGPNVGEDELARDWGAQPDLGQGERHGRARRDHGARGLTGRGVQTRGHVERYDRRSRSVTPNDEIGHGTARRTGEAVADE